MGERARGGGGRHRGQAAGAARLSTAVLWRARTRRQWPLLLATRPGHTPLESVGTAKGSTSSARASGEGSFARKGTLWKSAASNVLVSLEAVAEVRRQQEERTKTLAKENEEKLMREATKAKPGDSRTLADAAASREWRERFQAKYQVRSEMLRRWAKETPDPKLRRLEGKGPHAWLWRDLDVAQTGSKATAKEAQAEPPPELD